jgi:hypothetical protein
MGSEAAATSGEERSYTVTVCSDVPAGMTFAIARALTATMFARIRIAVHWHDSRDCPLDAIRVSLLLGPQGSRMPGVLGYALPYDGTHIVVFWDRIQAGQREGKGAAVLAHVLAHEIAHILQGCSRHSVSGLMKARWNADDFTAISRNELRFAPEDIELIYLGVGRRELTRSPL